MKIDKVQQSTLDYPSQELTLSVYFIGCEHNCKECSSASLADPDQPGQVLTPEELLQYVNDLNSGTRKIKTLTLVGGDPLHPANRKDVIEFCKLAKEQYDICVYTGYDISFLAKSDFDGDTFVSCIKYLITGKYSVAVKQESFKTDTEFQLASMNQQIWECDDEYITKVSKQGKMIFEQ